MMTLLAYRIEQRLNRFHRDEEGMIVWGLIVAILFSLVLTGFVYNTGKIVAAKIETQNAADAMVYSGSVWSARSMNTLTATNHLVGELNSLYVIHHALGGRHLDERNFRINDRTWEIKAADIALRASMLQLGGVLGEFTGIDLGPLKDIGLGSIPFLGHDGESEILKGTHSDLNSALFQAKLMLKLQMLKLYLEHTKKLGELVKVTGEALFYAATVLGIPIALGKLVEMGKIIAEIQELRRKERAIAREYKRLTNIERFAYRIRTGKKAIPGIISLLHKYQRFLVRTTPTNIRRCGRILASQHNVSGFVVGNRTFVDSSPLPVERETGFKTNFEERSQLIRATYPWVAYFRKFAGPALMAASPKSLVGVWYANWTERYTIQACEWHRTPTGTLYKDELTIINYRDSKHPTFPGGIDKFMGAVSKFINTALGKPAIGNGVSGRDTRLYVVKGLNAVNAAKGKEDWNNWRNRKAASRKIDDLFCQFAIAKSKKPGIASPAFFRQENPEGVTCFAQSMIYNANDKSAMTDAFLFGKDRQPKVTWDTLNWTGYVPEYEETNIFSSIAGAVGDYLQGFSQPKVKLNWQAKLTPVTDRRLRRGTVTARFMDRQAYNSLIAGREGLLLLKNQ